MISLTNPHKPPQNTQPPQLKHLEDRGPAVPADEVGRKRLERTVWPMPLATLYALSLGFLSWSDI